MTYVCQSSDGKIIPLIPNGVNIDVRHKDCDDYIKKAIKYRLAENTIQIQCVREGLEALIPKSLLTLLTGERLEQLVCGSQAIDVKTLKKIARYWCDFLNTFNGKYHSRVNKKITLGLWALFYCFYSWFRSKTFYLSPKKEFSNSTCYVFIWHFRIKGRTFPLLITLPGKLIQGNIIFQFFLKRLKNI